MNFGVEGLTSPKGRNRVFRKVYRKRNDFIVWSIRKIKTESHDQTALFVRSALIAKVVVIAGQD